MRQVARERLPFLIDEDRFSVFLKTDLQGSFDALPGGNGAANDGQLLTKPNRFLHSLRAKRLGPGQNIDRFQPVGLTLSVVAVDDIETRAPGDRSTQISKIDRLYSREQHEPILT